MAKALPIDPLLDDIVATLRHGNLVLEAPPGAGKTTRVPPALLDSVAGDIIVAQPRRLAARMAARRVASELGEPLGKRVGHQIRFDRVGGRDTRIWFVTEGILVRRLLADRDLAGVGAVILDEFHERSLDADVALALLRRLQRRDQPDLRLAVMSATIDAAPIASFVAGAHLVAAGRPFDVTIDQLDLPDDRPLEVQVRVAARKLLDGSGSEGDILVFLPGAAEIIRARAALDELAGERGVDLVTLHGDLAAAEQDRAIRPGVRPKIILSTNVAETSVTIEGVTAVIDSGLARQASHSPWSGLPTLRLDKISQASAIQRAGRAGRIRPGRCLRLYTKHDFATRPEHGVAEILRGDLTATILGLRAAAIDEPGWFEPPPAPALAAAEALLIDLGAVDSTGTITARGARMATLPLHPRLARLVVAGDERGIADEAALAAALLGERDLRTRELGRADVAELTGDSDVVAAIDLFDRRTSDRSVNRGAAAAVARAHRQIAGYCKGRQPRPDDPEAELGRALLSAFPDRVARRRHPHSSELILSGGGTARLADDSVVRDAELVVVVKADQRGQQTLARMVSGIAPEWLLDDFADRLGDTTEVVYTNERVEVISRLTYGKLVLDESRRPPAANEGEAAAEVLANAVLAAPRGVAEIVDGEALTRWRQRVAFVAKHCSEVGVTSIDDAVIERALISACRGASSLADLRRLDILAAIRATLPADQRAALGKLAPEKLQLRSGRGARVNYESGKPPWISARLQDFFGMDSTPRIANGRVELVIHLLAPNQRAVQVTTDLAGFWINHYPAIRKQLQRRYPLHAWPDDPTVAQPGMRPRQRR